MPSGRRLSLRIGKSRVEIAPKDAPPEPHADETTPPPEPSTFSPEPVHAATESLDPPVEEAVETDTEGTKRLGEMLMDEGIINEAQLEKAIAVQQEKGGFLGKLLVELGYCTEDQITACLARQCNIPYYNLNDYDIDEEVLSLIPSAICRKYKVIPIDRLGHILTVALLAPFDKGSLEAAQAACPNLKVKPILCSYAQFGSIIERVEGATGERGPAVFSADSLGFKETPKPSPTVEFDSKQHDSGIFDTGELVTIIQQSMQKAIDDLSALVRTGLPEGAAAGGVTADALRDALAENSRQLLEAVKQQTTTSAPPTLTREDLREVVREQAQALLQELKAEAAGQAPALDVDAVGDAVAKSIQPIVETHTQKALDELAQASRSPESVAELNNIARGIQKEISTVMDELMNAFSSQLRPVMTLLKSDDKFDRHETLVKSIYDSIREALESNHKDLGGQQSQLQELLREIHTTLHDTLAQAGQHAGQFGEIQQQLARMDDIVQSLQSLEELKAQLAGDGAAERTVGIQALDANDTRVRDEDTEIAAALSRDIDPSQFSFEGYHAGESTQETVNWCRHVAEHPGGGLAPLYLHGSPGTGKTHLVCAMANEIRKKHPGLRVGYMNTAQFTASYLDMLQNSSLDEFHAHFSHWDVLMLEDIQGMAHRPELQHELLQLLYVFTRGKRQLVLTSVEPVTTLPGFDYRVQSHLSACTCMAVHPPNWQQRLAILKRENEAINAPLNDELLGLIAMNIPGNIRHLIGALHQARAYAEQKGIKLTNEHADDLIRHITQG